MLNGLIGIKNNGFDGERQDHDGPEVGVGYDARQEG